MGVFVAAAALAAVGFLLVPWMILSAPLEPVMGFVQKIFYFHVPCASMLFLSTFTCAAGSIAYLFKGSESGDRLAAAAGELGVLFGTCTLVTGPLWGRKAWGVWWQWDARLTSSLLLFLILIAYLLARRYGGPAGRKLAAALALFAAVDVPLVYKSVDIWRTVYFHPLAGGLDAIVEWFKATGLTPFLKPLADDEREAFLAAYKNELATAYTPLTDGTVNLQSPRLFIVATR